MCTFAILISTSIVFFLVNCSQGVIQETIGNKQVQLLNDIPSDARLRSLAQHFMTSNIDPVPVLLALPPEGKKRLPRMQRVPPAPTHQKPTPQGSKKKDAAPSTSRTGSQAGGEGTKVTGSAAHGAKALVVAGLGFAAGFVVAPLGLVALGALAAEVAVGAVAGGAVGAVAGVVANELAQPDEHGHASTSTSSDTNTHGPSHFPESVTAISSSPPQQGGFYRRGDLAAYSVNSQARSTLPLLRMLHDWVNADPENHTRISLADALQSAHHGQLAVTFLTGVRPCTGRMQGEHNAINLLSLAEQKT